ncbi:barstar family protein [Zobellella sp. DQSA1]|uniref:barstar family protein n=1 Tax=Zobellella sp. DQSA1 TaxID=3342386 RepID=UPI0035C262F1
MNETELTRLLKAGPARSCCIPPDAQLALELSARRLGLDFYLVDFSGVDAKASCIAQLAGALELPAWFGQNWDALSDALTEPALVDGRGMVLCLQQVERFVCREPPGWLTLLDIMSEAAEYWGQQHKPFWCVVLSTSPALVSVPVLANH